MKAAEYKEIKIILIGAFICAVIGAFIFIVYGIDNSFSTGSFIGAAIFGIWMGLGVGGNIVFIPSLFVKGGFLLGWWDPVNTFGFNIFCILVNTFIGLLITLAAIFAFCIAGPIWPLIRILMKRSQIKKECNSS